MNQNDIENQNQQKITQGDEKEEQIPIQEDLVEINDEPASDDPNSVLLILRLPISGERHKRRFLKTDKVEYLYTYIDYLNSKGDCSFELES